MPETYGVVPADIAAELPGLYPGGFAATTKPTDSQVETWITTADAVVTMKVQDVTGAVPSIDDKAAVVAKRHIVEWVKGQVVRAAYVGNDPLSVKAAAEPYEKAAKDMLDALDALGSQATGTGAAASRVLLPTSAPDRDLLINSADIDGDDGYRERRF